MDLERVSTLLEEWGQPAYRGRQVYEAAMRGLAADYDEITALPRDLRRRLSEAEPLRQLQPAETQLSGDGTFKVRFATRDGFPVEAVAMMAAVAEQAESIAPYESWNESRVRRTESDPAYTIAHSLCVAARELRLDALVIPTLSGRSARLVSAHRPTVPIYALSPGKETVRRCSLMWGVQADSMPRHETTEALIADAARRVVELGWCKRGDRVGITAGLPSGRPGTTSLIQSQVV